MCGIAGFLSRGGLDPADAGDVLRAMTDAIAHRGPDDAGVWVDPDAGVALGHRRLSILDLSELGHQPMSDQGGRYCLVYNGEIYNFRELRQALEAGGERFRGHSDTEVLLAAIGRWGVRGALERANGMFAFAVWDRHEGVLTLARDRIGEKPLYYGWVQGALVFASELRSLERFPGFSGEIDRDALALFLRHTHVPGPFTVYRGVRKLLPGTLLRIRPGEPSPGPPPEVYWALADVVRRARRAPFRGSLTEAADGLEARLREVVRSRMTSDVPLGAFLSGGVDSSVITALMQALGSRSVRTFTVGFHEGAYDEARDARAVAEHLGTEHTELYVDPSAALELVPRLGEVFDEPFADSSQIPTHLVASLARRDVTVVLSGDAGDEVFGGYNRYFWGRSIWRAIGWVPVGLRARLAYVLARVDSDTWDRLGSGLRGGRTLAERVRQAQELLPTRDSRALYRTLVSHWQRPTRALVGAHEPETRLTRGADEVLRLGLVEEMMYLDTLGYLPDDILVKVDRAAMAVGLETRIPFLDPELLEFAWSLPLSYRVGARTGKRVLREVLYRYVPRPLVDRPKAGFAVPLASWLRGELRPWAEELLDAKRLEREGVFRAAPIRALWEAHLSGRERWHAELWCVLMFQAWAEARRAEAPPARRPQPRAVRG